MNIEYRIADICNNYIEDVSPETVRTIVSRVYDLIERVGYPEDEAINTACKEYCNEELFWYAVMIDNEDTDWGYGSFDLDEAKEMLKGYPDGYIAVIENDCCIREIRKEK